MKLQYLPQVHAGRHAQGRQDDVDRTTVFRVRHVFFRKDLRDDAFVAVATRELVAHADVPDLRHFDMDALNDAGIELVAFLAGEYFHADDAPALAVLHAKRRVFHIARFITENGTQEPLFGGELGFTFRRDLSYQDIAGTDFGADADDAVLVEVLQLGFADVRDVVRRDFRTELRVAHRRDEFLDVDRGEFAVFDQALGNDDGVFVVGARPAHERDKRVLTDSHLPAVGRGGVGEHVAFLHFVAQRDGGALVERGKAVGADEIDERVLDVFPFGILDDDVLRVHFGHRAFFFGKHKASDVACRALFDASRDERCFRYDARRRLFLHVAAHERAVCVVMFEERDHRSRDRERLVRRYVDVVDIVLGDETGHSFHTHFHFFREDCARFIVFDRGMCDVVPLFFERVQIHDFFRHDAVLHFGIGRFDHAEFVQTGMRRQVKDEPDVRTFRRVDRAEATVVGRMDVAHFKAGALARESPGAECGERTEVFKLGEHVLLLHELGELVRGEKFFDACLKRSRVYKLHRKRRLGVDGRHAVLDVALHVRHADAQALLQ
ncbi:MAG: hypothetical protein UY94_C0043G0001, partial [Parcubacteria group bacterium GW2011_GWA2_56_21]